MSTSNWQVLSKETDGAFDLSRELFSATGPTVSRRTVYRRLGRVGPSARGPIKCVSLTTTHCRLRITTLRFPVDLGIFLTQSLSTIQISLSSKIFLSLGFSEEAESKRNQRTLFPCLCTRLQGVQRSLDAAGVRPRREKGREGN
ncbi:hypothetical protein TNCV_3774421 [Trichonephila clavipes]|nr:hypothetical protein TNCV_3774421 [Trichonephila clavipes]